MQQKLVHLDHIYADPNWTGPEIVYGKALIKEATNTTERYAVMTMEIPWNLVKDDVVKQPEAVLYVPDTHLATFEKLEQQVRSFLWLRGLGLLRCPIVIADAGLTPAGWELALRLTARWPEVILWPASDLGDYVART